MAVIDLSQHNFDNSLANSEIIIIYFWAPWCDPCLQFATTFKKASEKIADVFFAKVNTEEEQLLSSRFSILSIPAIIIFRKGISIFSHLGALTLTDIEVLATKAKELDMNEVRKNIKDESAKKTN